MDIKSKRLLLNLTQEDLANTLKVSRSAVAMWETGNSLPTAGKLPELAKILKCDIADLFEEKKH